MFPLSTSEPKNKIPLVTILVILTNVLVFLYELVTPNYDLFIMKYALIPGLLDSGNLSSLFPFISSMFLHGGFMHIISNMWFLWVFGGNVEERLGHVVYLGFYLIAGIIAAFSQIIFDLGSMIPLLGASGAIAGVLGFYFVVSPGSRVKTLVIYYTRIGVYNVSAKYMLGLWALTQIFYSVGSIGADTGGVAWLAHIGGFLFGLFGGYIFNSRKRQLGEPVSVFSSRWA
ncbi:rhomboid family intramembrane serine protease [Candidatus Dojkabacteria bacterium]|uniref:Rhomboid family intramembrane serine protease n=1 Tax=Candidatus Dojkabacteria bacterium TaxID=2099670 RepID=A0A955I557_9BACT|nr:rhomboid family intramembrane serine protease [Candidatus Dojkabacteria bacterium]